MAGLSICTKQSIGATLAVIVVLYKLLFIENKEQFKEYVKSTIIRVLGISIPVIILIILLIIAGAISEFINYAVLGISTFSNKIAYWGLLQDDKIEIRVLSILVPVSIIIMALTIIISKVLKKENEQIKKILTLFIYSLSIIIVMYPISDKIHFLIGSFISIIGIIYIIGLLGKKIYNKLNFNKKYKIYKIATLVIWIFLFAIILTKGITNLYKYINTDKNTEINHYKNIEIWDNLEKRINELDTYIIKKEQEGKKVYILDAEAAIYMIPIDKYNKDYDMFLKGNIGKDGEQGQIEKIKKRDLNSIYLIRKQNLKLNWQTPTKVLEYIRQSLQKIGEIQIYEIYE